MSNSVFKFLLGSILLLFISLFLSYPSQAAPEITDNLLRAIPEDIHFEEGRAYLDLAWEARASGNTQLTASYFDLAQQSFTKSLALQPQNLAVLMNRGTAYIGLEWFDLAQKDFDQALQLDNSFSPAYEGKAIVFELLGDINQAEEMNQTAKELYQAQQEELSNQPIPPAPAVPQGYNT